jgi:hypothetical protein
MIKKSWANVKTNKSGLKFNICINDTFKIVKLVVIEAIIDMWLLAMGEILHN